MKIARLSLALLLLFGNVFSLAAEEEAISASRKAHYFYLEGIRLESSGKFDAAFEMFRHAVSIDSTASAALFELSDFYIKMNRQDAAQSLLKQAITIDGTNFNYKVLYAGLLMKKGDVDGSVQIYESLVADYPDKPELSYYLGELYAEQKEFMKAVKAFDDLEQTFGVSDAISMRKYQLYEAAGREEEGFNEIEKLTQKNPSSARYLILLGSIYLEKEQFGKANEQFQRAAEIDPDDPDLLVSMVSYYDLVGDKEQSAQLMEKALTNPDVEIDVKLSILSSYIEALLRNRKEMERANVLFSLLLEQHPQMAELYHAYGLFLLSQGKEEEALFQLELATEIEPLEISVWLRILSLYASKKEHDNVILTSRKALTYLPDSPELYYFLGITYYQKDELQEALAILEEGLGKMKKENLELISDYYGQMGDLYFQLGMKDKAFAGYDEALVYNPDNIMILNNYAYFLSLENRDLPKAESMSARTVSLDPKNSTFLDTYAWIFFMQGNYTLAKMYIESAINNGGTEVPEILEHYGDILFKSGDKEKAVREWRKAFELNSSSEELRRKIKEATGEDPARELKMEILEEEIVL